MDYHFLPTDNNWCSSTGYQCAPTSQIEAEETLLLKNELQATVWHPSRQLSYDVRYLMTLSKFYVVRPLVVLSCKQIQTKPK